MDKLFEHLNAIFEDPAYSQVKHDIFTSASEEDLELEPRPPVTLRASKPEDLFDVHEELGKGKFGVVKKVTEKSTQTVFAAKYIRLSSSSSGSSRDDIMREINIMNQLHHKRLVGLIDAFDVSKNIVMVMEFVSGGELFERVADADCLTEKEAAYYMYQLLQGLQYMHKKNIIHLDLKPENIVCVSKDSWDIKLIDFGLAQELTPGITMKALKGTPEFMAPEAVNFDTISFSTDMWSVGVIAYILLSGLSPLLGDDVNETLANVTAAEWDFEDESFDVISEEAKNFISMLLVKNPRKRNTVGESLKHDWMKRSASANAVKIDTKKLKQFLAKRRWQKSVNALVAVRRLSNITSLMGLKGRPSIAPSLATVASAEEEDEEEKETGAEKKVHLETRKEKAIGGHQSKDEHTVSKKEDIPIIDESVEEDEKGNKKETSMQSPVFIKELSDISANEGDTVSLEVVISHDINCGVDWFKNGGDVTEGGRLSLVNHGEGRYALVIRDTEEDDSGEFCCVAANEAGKVTCAGHLTIEVLSKSDNTDEEEEEIDSSIEVPVFAKELSDVTASERDTVTLEVVVSGASPYELEWFKNAVDITECERISLVNHDDGRFSLVIRDCEDDDTGEYCCVAQNEAGRVTCAGWLTVEVESSKSEEEESEESEVEEIVWKEIVEIREGDVQTFYCIEEEVGRGRFGIVKKCVELDTATRFCAKFIKSRPSQKAEFKREIDVMNTLHHPRLIRLYDAFEEPRQIILIMEYARGGDLFARIDGDSLPEFEAVKILTQVLEGLKYMHDNHFMHLDLKPQNVMFKNEGGSKIKLIDFSLSRKFDSQQEVKISFGTAEYVAPEIVNYEPVTLAADMWAIGVISYIMLSGDSPFLGPSEAETFSKITEARWEFTDVFDYVSKEAKNFITRLLLKDPKQRMTVDECLAHEWIKSPGFTGKHQSKSSSEGELASDVNHNIVSPTELKRQESKKFDEQDAPLDIHQLEAKLKELLTKAQSEKKEREELEERLREEEERADALEDELRESETMVKKFEENMSKLGKENTDLMKKARTNSETLKRVAESEGEKRGLEDKLAEQTKSREVLIRKYDSLKEKLESYDILEEKVYLLERDRKESRGTKEKLESKIEGYEREREFLLQKDDKNDLEMTEFETEISKLKKERTEYENKYVTLREEKESLVEELTKRFSALDEQKKILAEEKVHLERDLEAVKTENEEMKVKFQRVAEEWELSKEKANKENGEKDKDEVENLSKLKRQKDEAQKTCEDLASKLSKAYVELERARSQDNNETDAVNLQEQISTLKESLSSLKRDRDHVEEELEEREAEIEELKKKIEQLETDKTALTEERDKQSVDYKAQIDMANEKIVALQRASRGRDEDNRNSEMLQSEVSTLREKLAAAKRTNEELEAKVKSNGEAQHSVLEETVVVKRTSQLQSSQSSLFEENDRGYELKKDERSFQSTSPLTKDQRDVNGAADSRMTSMREETGSESLFSLKKNFKLQKKLSQELETSLKREVQKTQMLEDELDNFELEKRRGMTMYRDLEEECERLRKELDDVECSQSEVRLREKLRSRLKAQEEESNALNRQVDYLKKEVQSLKEERDGGNTLYVNLAEKFKNLMKENKQLEQEKHERDQKEKESREMEDSLQTRILELVSMKDEIEAMRDNLRALVREKEGGVKEFTSLQRDYGKLANDCKVLQKQVNEERNRGDNLAKERASLQKKAEEMQKDLNQIDLIAAADKRAIETYAHENKSLKDEKGNQVKETERLRKESKDLYDDLKELKRKKEGEDGVMQEKESLLREVEKFRNENRALLEEREEFDKATKHLNSLRGENASALEEIEVLRKENEALLREREEFNEMKKHLNSLREENARVLEEKEVLRKQNEVLLKTREEFNEVTKHLNSLREENANVLKEKEVLKKENVALLKEHEEFNETKKHLNSFKEENASALEEKKVLRKQNEVLLKDREEFDAMKKHLNSLREENASALEEKEVLRKENEALLNNRKELSEMKKRLNCLKEENASDLEEKEALRRENEDLLSDLEDLRKRGQEYLDVLKCDKERALKETEKLKKENEILLKFRKTKGDIDNLQLPSSEDNQTLRRKSEELETNLQKQALEAMRLKKESTTLKKKVETLTKEIQRLRDERRPREIHKTSSGKETGYKEIEDRYKATVAQVTTCEEEVGFLRKEVEDLTDDKNELLQTYNVLQKEFDRYKGEFCDLEKCLEIKSNDLQTVTELKTLAESRTKELEERLRSLSVENERIRNDLRHVTEDFDSQKEKLDLTEKELRDFTNENEEIHKSYIDLEEKYSCIRKINRELEEDVEIEMRKLSEVKARNEGLSTENSNLRQEIKKLQREFDEKQGVSERSDYERGELNKRIQHLEKKRAKDKACKSEFEVQLTDEKNRSKNLEERKKKLEDQLKGLKEELETKKQEAISALEEELHDLRPLKERANALETEREQLRDKLDFEIRSRDSKTKEIELKKKENDSLLYELESTRHRLVSNVLNPLEEAQLSWNFRVNAADISAGKSKAWSSMKENIVALIRERERLRTENSSLQQACSRMKEEYPVTKQERDQLELTVESVESRQIVQGIVADQDKTDALEHSRKEDLLAKELEVLHKRSDEDEEKMDLLMKEKQDLIGQLEFMKQMQLTADYERDRLADQRGLFAPMENRLGLSFQSETKFQSVQTMERISIIEHQGGVGQQSYSPIGNRELTQWNGNHSDTDSAEEEQLKVARELVRRNRRIFELEQEIALLLKRGQSSNNGKIATEKYTADIESAKEEILRLETENKNLKELSIHPSIASLQKEIGILEADNNSLRTEKEDLVMQISAKDKKIELLEKRVKELTEIRSCTVNGTENGECIEINETEAQTRKYDEELKKAKHRTAELEVELEHFNNSYNAKRKRELDEMETKWAKRLRKECMELQSELSDKHNREKQLWLKKEVELQNIIRQMKIVMDKRLGQAENERRKLEQQLMTVRSSSFHGSMISLDSNSDDSGESPSITPGATSNDVTPGDCLSDRELRRVAYKLNGEEWSQLGTFLGVGDRDLAQLSALSMGPQEKAFRLLCVWRTRCRLGRAQMISQLAVSLEEVKRKDVAQFVLEQFMSGKPRKKLFGW